MLTPIISICFGGPGGLVLGNRSDLVERAIKIGEAIG